MNPPKEGPFSPFKTAGSFNVSYKYVQKKTLHIGNAPSQYYTIRYFPIHAFGSFQHILPPRELQQVFHQPFDNSTPFVSMKAGQA